MNIFRWDEKYSVGIQSIDDQHKEIFRVMDQLFQSLKSGMASHTIMQIIVDLENYAVLHFKNEESYFSQFNFEGLEKHIIEHKEFIENMATYKADAQAGKLASSFELLHYLKVWIDHHILEVDMEYSECFKKNGLN